MLFKPQPNGFSTLNNSCKHSVASLTHSGDLNYMIYACEFWSHGIYIYLSLLLSKILHFIFGILKL